MNNSQDAEISPILTKSCHLVKLNLYGSGENCLNVLLKCDNFLTSISTEYVIYWNILLFGNSNSSIKTHLINK